MITFISEKLPRILKNKKRFENKLKIELSNRGKEITIKGSAEQEYIAEKVFRAIDLGFPLSVALMIDEQDYSLEMVNIKDHTKKDDLKRIRGRIIGKKGRTLKTLSSLTKCYFEIKDNTIGIIGDPEYVKNAHEAIISIIKGSKQSNVYSHLEKNQPKPIIDLGLKENYK